MKIPKIFGDRFKVVSELVTRPNCKIYSATDGKLADRSVALKIFAAQPEGDQQLVEQFSAQVAELRAASHPALVPIIAGGDESDWFYIAMELLDGSTLRDMLKQQAGPLEPNRAAEIFHEIAEGLIELHANGVAHGHVDARAVLFKANEPRLAGYYPAVIDTIQHRQSKGTTSSIEMTCIAPEQIENPANFDARTDIYALGVVLYQMLTGKKPFLNAESRLVAPPPSPRKANPELPALVDAAIMKALSRNPDERFQDCEQFLSAVTGGKAAPKNPLAGISTSEEMAERLGGTTGSETIAVSMSTDVLKQMLAKHDAPQAREEPVNEPVKQALAVNGSAHPSTTSASHENEALDVQSTVMGMQAQALLRASMVIVEGKQRGKKFMLDKPQVMLGSDATCEICIPEKNVPKRYAIMIQRGQDYFVGALSPQGLYINGSEVTGSDEVPLQRGDTISIGASKLRFVAPGEVFTLQENVADRVIDREKSKLPSLFIGIALLVFAVSAAGLYFYFEDVEDAKLTRAQQESRKAKKREALIDELLREGDGFLKAGALTEPVGANARETFQNVLELKPDHNYAKRRLRDIEEQLVAEQEKARKLESLQGRISQLRSDADRYFRAQDYVVPPGRNAKETYQEILKIDPDDAAAKARIEEINGILAGMLSMVEVMLAKAEVYRALGQYIEPPEENALRMYETVRRIDPQNEVAEDALISMAAEMVYEGDVAKESLDPDRARLSYDMAIELGVDPVYVEPRLTGLDLIERSNSGVVIYSGKEGEDAPQMPLDTSGKYLDSRDVERKVRALAIKHGKRDSSRRQEFIDIRKQR